MQKFFGIAGLVVGLYSALTSGLNFMEGVFAVCLFGFLGLAAGWTLRVWLFRNTGV